MFKKIFAMFARYNANERLESDLAKERGERAQEQARERMRQQMEQKKDEVTIEVPTEEVPTPRPPEVPRAEEEKFEQAA
jgi:hypothetical protein